jgi:hypothetical protein
VIKLAERTRDLLADVRRVVRELVPQPRELVGGLGADHADWDAAGRELHGQ